MNFRDLVDDYRRDGGVDNEWRFDNVVPLAKRRADAVEFREYDDVDRSLCPVGTDLDAVCRKLAANAVLILSLKLVEPRSNAAPLDRGFHMLSFYDLRNDIAQVWDSINLYGFFSISDLVKLMTADTHFHQYHMNRDLIAHPQHHCLLVSPRQ
jgi:hypothetical protein